MFYPILIAIVGLVPAAFLILRLRHAQSRRLATAAAPFPGRFPRPPGEHLRLRIGELETRYEEALDSLLVPCILVTSVAIIGSILVTETLPLSSHLSMGGLVLTVAAFICHRRGPGLRRLLSDLETNRLGFEGERRVGAILGALERDGYSVFHDLPLQPNDGAPFHLDHVVVGPGGIFAIETVTRKKDPGARSRSEITPRGSYLVFSGRETTHDSEHLDAARDHAWTFEAWLSTHIVNPGTVHSILTFPGWQVNQSERSSDVAVLNPKQIRDHILSFGRPPSTLAIGPLIQPPALDPARVAALRSLLATVTERPGSEDC